MGQSIINESGTIREIGLKEGFFWMIGKRKRFKISGLSMQPLLREGDQVLAAPGASVAVGDIVILNHPFKKNLILLKQVTQVDGKGLIEIRGTNRASSSDSAVFGKVKMTDIIGKVTARIGAQSI